MSSPTTADAVTRAMAAVPATATQTYRLQLEGLRDGLTVFTAAVYPQSPARDPYLLNEATRHALSVAPHLSRT